MFSVDRSQNGLGTALLQNVLPVAYASKALNESQHRFPQIEKELLALVFGCEQFHQYIFGCAALTIKTAHKPLVVVLKKNLNYP